MNPRIYLHDETTGDPIRQIPIEWWLRFEASTHVNKVTKCQGAYSPCQNPQMVNLYETRDGLALHDITTLWTIPLPRSLAFASNDTLIYEIWDKYLTVYNKQEWQESSWRYREFEIGHDPKMLMDMCVIAGDLANPDGTFTGVVGGTTSEQMEAISLNALANNPQVSTAITSVAYVGPVGGLGLPLHPISYNCDNWLDAMIDLEAASFYAWSRGLITSPVEFRLVPTSNNTWELEIGLFARDRRFDGIKPDPIILSPRRGNIISAESTNDHSKAITEAIVLGRGTGAAKETERVVDPVRSLYSKFNLRQSCVRGHKAPTGSTGANGELETIGESFFREKGEADTMIIKEYQRGGARLLIDVRKFDWITISLNGRNQDVRVVGYTAVWENGKPPVYSLDVELLDGRQQRGKSPFEMAVDKLNTLEEWQQYVATEIS